MGQWETTARDAQAFKESKKEFCRRSGGTGETPMRVAQRIYNLLDEICAQPDRTYILVSHNGIARVVNSYFHEMTNDEYASFGVKNCAVVRYDF